MTQEEKKKEARRLRTEQRMSAGEIRRKLDIAKATLSYWLKDIPLTPEERRQHLVLSTTRWHASNPAKLSRGAKHSEAVGRGTRGRHKAACPDSILDLSSRTVVKILKRMGLGCSRCGWNKGACDIHHIHGRKVPDAKGHWNLAYICPNCHREFHSSKTIPKESFKPLSDQLGDSWKAFYYG